MTRKHAVLLVVLGAAVAAVFHVVQRSRPAVEPLIESAERAVRGTESTVHRTPSHADSDEQFTLPAPGRRAALDASLETPVTSTAPSEEAASSERATSEPRDHAAAFAASLAAQSSRPNVNSWKLFNSSSMTLSQWTAAKKAAASRRGLPGSVVDEALAMHTKLVDEIGVALANVTEGAKEVALVKLHAGGGSVIERLDGRSASFGRVSTASPLILDYQAVTGDGALRRVIVELAESEGAQWAHAHALDAARALEAALFDTLGF